MVNSRARSAGPGPRPRVRGHGGALLLAGLNGETVPFGPGHAHRDAIVVGGGHNGLACAAYLARTGMDVLVLERREVLGGAAVTEEPWPGRSPPRPTSSASYRPRSSASSSLLPLRKRVHHRSGLLVPVPRRLVAHAMGRRRPHRRRDPEVLEGDADAYLQFDRYFERVGRLLRDLLFVVPPNLTIRELPRWLGVGRKLHWTAGTSPRPFACSRSVAPTSSTSGSRTNG